MECRVVWGILVACFVDVFELCGCVLIVGVVVDGLVEGLLVDFDASLVWTAVEYVIGFGTAVVLIVELAVDELIVDNWFVSPTEFVELLSEYDDVLGFEEAVFGMKVEDLLELVPWNVAGNVVGLDENVGDCVVTEIKI